MGGLDLSETITLEAVVMNVVEDYWRLLGGLVIILDTPFAETAVVYDGSNSYLTTVPRNITLNATTILLGRNLIHQIRAEMFVNYTDCSILDLSSNRIVSIHQTALCNNRLININLAKNRLMVVPNVTCLGETLKSLTLSYNLIQDIIETDFMHLRSLSVLGLMGNAITDEDLAFLLPLKDNIKQISLVANKLTNISSHFQNFSMLEHLHLSKNSLASIPDDAFTNCISLKYFFCFKCALDTFPLFNAQTVGKSLNGLNLKNNNIKNISMEQMEVFSALNGIYLDNNPLGGTVMSIFTWSGRHTLEKLYLRNTNMKRSTMASMSFSGFDALNIVSMASDVLTIMPNLTGVASTLTRLDMDRSQVKSHNIYISIVYLNTR